MTSTTQTRPVHSPGLPLRYLFGVLLTLALALAPFYLVMRPSMFEMEAMALFLSITAGISVLAGYGAYRAGWIYRSPRITWTLLGGYALASILTFLNVWMTARLMFANQHDLLLATMLLVFAGGIAMSLGYFMAAALNDGISELNAGARAVADGDLDARVPVRGNNEMAELAQTFNAMANQLQTADRKQRQLDTMRRNLVAWTGHDLRTPLASIQAMIEALADDIIQDPDTVRRYHRTIQRDVQALAHLIDDLFDLAQYDAGGLELDRRPTSLADLISDSIERFSETAAQQSIQLSGRVDEIMDVVYIDAQKIGRVLTNLIANAIRHTPKEGSVWAIAKAVSDGTQVEVGDSGEGISQHDLPYIFDQFYRGEKSRSRSTGGSGLGLAITRRIIQAHGGDIWVESEVGRGTRFFFFLPDK